MLNMRIFFIKIFILATILASILTFTVFFPLTTYDSTNTTNNHKQEAGDLDLIVKSFINGQDLVVDHNSWSRENFHMRFASLTPTTYDVLIFGTSHINFLDNSVFPNHKSFNLSFPGSGLSSIDRLFTIFKERGKLPDKIYFGLDFWYLQNNSGYKPFSIYNNFYKLRFLEIFEYIRRSIRYISKNLITKHQQVIFGINHQLMSNYFKRPSIPPLPYSPIKLSELVKIDGSANRPNKVDPLPTTLAQFRASRSRINTDRFLERPLYHDQVKHFELIVSKLKEENIEVIFVITPLHPIAYQYYKDDPVFKISQNYYQEIATKMQFQLIGSYNPDDCGMSNDDFMDDNHLSPEAIKKLITFDVCLTR